MVPVCFPSKISSTTGLREAVVYALPSVTGLVRWTDYIPVKLVASADAALEGRTDAGGFIPMDMLSSNTGLMGWVDYLPVYVDNSATDAWAITATGFIPYAASGGGLAIPSFYLNFSNNVNVTLANTQARGSLLVGGGGGTITPSIVEARSSGVAPLSVFFDASGTTAASLTSKPFHELVYVWSFGDTAGGATWTYGARSGLSKNQAFGPVASHVFETAGSYTVTLTVFHFDSGGTMSSASTTTSITVTNADTVFSGTNTIVFATDGVFTGKPTGAQEVTASDFASAVNTYQASGKRLLFKKGQTFTNTSVARLSVGSSQIGAWGSGAKPIVNLSASVPSLVFSGETTPNITDMVAMDIDFRGGGNANTSGVSWDGACHQAVALRIDVSGMTGTSFGNSQYAIDGYNGGAHPGHLLWDQLSVIDCTSGSINGGVASSGPCAAFLAAKRLTVMGNSFDNNSGAEHILRTPIIIGGVVQNNYLARPANSKHTWQAHGPWEATFTFTTERSSKNLVASNNYHYDPTAAWLVYMGPTNLYNELIKDVIIESCYFNAAGGGKAMVIKSSSLFTVRNNVSNVGMMLTFRDGTNTDTSSQSYPAWPVNDDMRFYNNTFYSLSTSSLYAVSFEWMGNNPAANNSQAFNNLVYCPNSTDAKVFYDNSGSGTNTSGTSSTNGQATGTSPLFSSVPSGAATLSATDFKVTSGSYAIDSATYKAGVFRDLQYVVRTTPHDMGAVQA